ncbi:plasmid replication DNA-binding protein [Acinetobacter sp. ME22]|uniref:plasmid replication DNA-binding protein n=1 Tax=Acinetobacter sp. ME22 TaxID=2904802 RepID=UPI001EDA5732|nr:plasmid replication DNA-binding protein [Acinetobacter sp. ME22]MCG2575295.1 plasmid replication DNA-binding protein [Acinetobacter sp. ME22]
MAKLSLSEVSNRFNVSRSTLYRAIKEGRLSRSADGHFDIAEVIRCFGEPTKKTEQNQIIDQPKDDADLRQLVDFMKKEIEAYKDREKRYLDQIDRFQLLLGHKESSEKLSHETPVTHPNDTPCDTSPNVDKNIDKQYISQKNLSHETPVTRANDTPRDNIDTSNDTFKKHQKKRGLFGRVIDAVFNEN